MLTNVFLANNRRWKLPLCSEKWIHLPDWPASQCGELHHCLHQPSPRSHQERQQHLKVWFLQTPQPWLLETDEEYVIRASCGAVILQCCTVYDSAFSHKFLLVLIFCFSLTTTCSHHVSTELGQELSKTKRVRIAEEVILEDESKPKKKKKKDGGKQT